MNPPTAALHAEPTEPTEPTELTEPAGRCRLDDVTVSAIWQHLSVPPKALLHIKGYHNSAEVHHPILDFDIWIDCLVEPIADSIQLRTSFPGEWQIAVYPPSDEIDSLDLQYAWLKRILTTTLNEAPLESISVQKGVNPCDMMAIKTNVRRCADVVKYAGSLDVEVHCTGIESTLLPSSDVFVDGTPQNEPSMTIKKEWAADWPLQRDPLAGRIAPFHLPSSPNTVRLTSSNRTWLNRLQHAIVDGHRGYINLNDEIADGLSPRMKAVETRGLRTAVYSQAELRGSARRITKLDTWGGDE
jgi:hypothetical protein